MKGTVGENFNVIFQFFIYAGVAFVGMGLHAASGHESSIILLLAWLWVGIVYTMTMYRFHRDAEKESHERNHFIIKVEYDKDSPIRSDIVNSFSGKLSEFEEQCAIEMFCRNAINEKCREIREANRNIY